MIHLPLADGCVVEFTAEARLPRAGPFAESGHLAGSPPTLRRIKLGNGSAAPELGVGEGVPLRNGNIYAFCLGTYMTLEPDDGVGDTETAVDPSIISWRRSPMIVSIALAANWSALD